MGMLIYWRKTVFGKRLEALRRLSKQRF